MPTNKKLTDEQVLLMREDYKNKKALGLTLVDIAKKYNVSTPTVLYRCKPGQKEKINNYSRVFKKETYIPRKKRNIKETNYSILDLNVSEKNLTPEEAFKQIQELRKANEVIRKSLISDVIKNKLIELIDIKINNLKNII